VPQAQLELALEGPVEYVYAYSFILTDLEGDAAEIEHWHRQRAQIEERVKEAELGDGLLRHSGRQPGLADGPGDRAQPGRPALGGGRRRQSPSPAGAAGAVARATTAASRCAGGQSQHQAGAALAAGMPGRVLHGGRRVVLRLAQGMLWAATFIAACQRLCRLTSSA